jgi:hypothetical protein
MKAIALVCATLLVGGTQAFVPLAPKTAPAKVSQSVEQERGDVRYIYI